MRSTTLLGTTPVTPLPLYTPPPPYPTAGPLSSSSSDSQLQSQLQPSFSSNSSRLQESAVSSLTRTHSSNRHRRNISAHQSESARHVPSGHRPALSLPAVTNATPPTIGFLNRTPVTLHPPNQPHFQLHPYLLSPSTRLDFATAILTSLTDSFWAATATHPPRRSLALSFPQTPFIVIAANPTGAAVRLIDVLSSAQAFLLHKVSKDERGILIEATWRDPASRNDSDRGSNSGSGTPSINSDSSSSSNATSSVVASLSRADTILHMYGPRTYFRGLMLAHAIHDGREAVFMVQVV